MNERLGEFKVDNQMLNQLRDSLSKIAFERDNFNSLLIYKDYLIVIAFLVFVSFLN